jgi:DNA-binding response OmpR family regulator
MLCTAGFDGYFKALKAAGATDYLTKPYRVKELLAIIDSTAPSRASAR